MALKLLDRLSLPGDPARPNEDASACDEGAALVLDGATPLGPPLLPGPSDAHWIANFGARRLMAHLKDHGAQEALRAALSDAQKSFAALKRGTVHEKWQTPCAALMMVVEENTDPPPLRGRSPLAGEGARRQRANEVTRARTEREQSCEGELEFLWFGDCAALLADSGQPAVFIGAGMKSRARESARARIALDAGIAPTDRAKAQAVLRAGRGRINSGDNWLFSPEPRAAEHAGHAAHALAPGGRLLLATDGFLALASDYGAYDLDGLLAAAGAKGLAALGAELRAIEEADAAGEKFPRFKQHDDATALLLEVVSS